MSNRNVVKLISLGLMFSVVLACGTPNVGGPPPESEGITKDEFVIGPEDVLRIDVWKHPNISATVPVRSDGKVSIPLVNDIQAAGLTPHQLKDEIAKRLANFIEEPTVSVIVEAINSQKIIVTGAVTSPGVYKVHGKISLIEAISLVGGITAYGNPEKIRIIRKENGVEKIYQVI